MTVRDQLHLLVDRLSDDEARAALVVLAETRDSAFAPDGRFWRFVGSGHLEPGAPTDIAEQHDRYLTALAEPGPPG